MGMFHEEPGPSGTMVWAERAEVCSSTMDPFRFFWTGGSWDVSRRVWSWWCGQNVVEDLEVNDLSTTLNHIAC